MVFILFRALYIRTIMVLVLSSCDTIHFNSCVQDDQVRCFATLV